MLGNVVPGGAAPSQKQFYKMEGRTHVFVDISTSEAMNMACSSSSSANFLPHYQKALLPLVIHPNFHTLLLIFHLYQNSN